MLNAKIRHDDVKIPKYCWFMMLKSHCVGLNSLTNHRLSSAAFELISCIQAVPVKTSPENGLWSWNIFQLHFKMIRKHYQHLILVLIFCFNPSSFSLGKHYCIIFICLFIKIVILEIDLLSVPTFALEDDNVTLSCHYNVNHIKVGFLMWSFK